MWLTVMWVLQVYVKKGEVDSKMMAALLTGVNRAYPFAKGKSGPQAFGAITH